MIGMATPGASLPFSRLWEGLVAAPNLPSRIDETKRGGESGCRSVRLLAVLLATVTDHLGRHIGGVADRGVRAVRA
jgi:hypothetical protein